MGLFMRDVLTSKQEEKKFKPSTIVLFSILSLLFVLLALVIIFSIVSIVNEKPNVFSHNMVRNCVYIILTGVALTFVDYLITKGKLAVKDWLICTIYGVVFLLLNVFNVFRLYDIVCLNILANNILGLLYAVVGVSIYYNYLKNEGRTLKARAMVVVIFSLCFSIGFGFLIELVKYISACIFGLTRLNFGQVALNVVYVMVGSGALNLLFYLSLKRKKKFINVCLIETN